MEANHQIENIYLKIFEFFNENKRCIYYRAAQIAYNKEIDRTKFLKEITQQLVNTRENMIKCFGEEIINEIDGLNLKVRKIRQVKQFKNVTN